MSIVKILGINVTFSSFKELVDTIFSQNVRTVTYANHHHLNLASSDSQFFENLNSFDIIHADGIGTKFTGKILKTDSDSIPYVTGSDLYPFILEKLLEEELSLYIIGSAQHILEKAVQNLQLDYPGLNIVGFRNGYFDFEDFNIIEEINSKNPYLVLVGFGAPHQEYWISKWKNKLSAQKIIAIGGWLDIRSGFRKRGPKWMRKIGLEWTIRLLLAPTRNWKRYILGIPRFLYRVFKQKIK